MMSNKIVLAIIGVFLIIFVGLMLVKNGEGEQELGLKESVQEDMIDEVETMSIKKPEEITIDKTKSYVAKLTTSEGEMVIELAAKETPITVNNYVYLAREGFYDGTIFHRVIDGFIIQGGDPDGTGTGGPGYRFDDEPFSGKYTRGTVAMANAGPNTNGSQFFIMHKDYDLPPNYVIFGKISEGLEVLDKIATAKVAMSLSGEMSNPEEPVKLETVEIIEE